MVDWIVANQDRKTHTNQLSAILCASSVDALITYCEAFKRKRKAGQQKLLVATIFTYAASPEDPDADGLIVDLDLNVADLPVKVHKRDKLESCVADCNAMYQTKGTVKECTGFDPRALDLDAQTFKDDKINVAYILALLAAALEEADSLDPKVRDASKAKRNMTSDLLGSARQLRSKRDLIEKFIEEHMPGLGTGQDVQAAFSDFWNAQRLAAIEHVCAAEQIDPAAFKTMIEQYHFSGKRPLQGEIVDALSVKPKILERKSVGKRIVGKLLGLVSTFDDGMGAV